MGWTLRVVCAAVDTLIHGALINATSTTVCRNNQCNPGEKMSMLRADPTAEERKKSRYILTATEEEL